MKKELLLASALASTVGMAGIAEAASATFSGHNRTGVNATNPDTSDSLDRCGLRSRLGASSETGDHSAYCCLPWHQ